GPLLDLVELRHERLVDRQAAGGIEDHDVAVGLVGALDRGLADLGRRRVLHREHRHAELPAEHLELLDGGGTVDVGGHHHRPLLVPLEPARQLADRGRLARALEADHHDRGRALLGPVEVGVDRPHQVDQLLLTDAHEVLLGRRRQGAVAGLGAQLHRLADRLFLHAIEERLGDLELDVGFEQRHAHVAQRVLDVVRRQLGDAGQASFGVAEPARECFEHPGGLAYTASPMKHALAPAALFLVLTSATAARAADLPCGPAEPGTVTLDGLTDDWGEVAGIDAGARDPNLSFTLKCNTEGQTLLLLVDVRDSYFVRTRAAKPGEDHIALTLAGHTLTIFPGDARAIPTLVRWGTRPAKGIKAVSALQQAGWAVELAIPMSVIPGYKVGAPLAYRAAVADCDSKAALKTERTVDSTGSIVFAEGDAAL